MNVTDLIDSPIGPPTELGSLDPNRDAAVPPVGGQWKQLPRLVEIPGAVEQVDPRKADRGRVVVAGPAGRGANG